MRRIAVHVENDLYEAIDRVRKIERRSKSALCASILEAVLTDGGTVRLEDVGVPDREVREHADDSRTPHKTPGDASPTGVRGSGAVSRYFDRKADG